MIAMSPTVTLKGKVKFDIKKYVTGGEMTSSEYKGPGEVLFAPSFLGDVASIRLPNPNPGAGKWKVGKDAFLASTAQVTKTTKSQGLSKAIFSGESLFVYEIDGIGILWVSSFGAIVKKEVSQRFHLSWIPLLIHIAAGT